MADDLVRCSKCRRKYPVSAEHWYLRENGRRNGRVCRHCHHLKVRKAPAKCRHCHKSILGRTAQSKYHIDADHPDCYAAYQAHILDKQRHYQAANKDLLNERRSIGKDKRRATGQLCPICKRQRLPRGHVYMCRTCQQNNPDEGDLIYFSERNTGPVTRNREECDGEQGGA